MFDINKNPIKIKKGLIYIILSSMYISSLNLGVYGKTIKKIGIEDDREDYNMEIYGGEDYDRNVWDEYGINKYTGTEYNIDGYDIEGWNEEGINKETGTEYDIDGYDMRGFNLNGTNKFTNTQYDPNGYDKNGFDKNGFDVYDNGMG